MLNKETVEVLPLFPSPLFTAVYTDGNLNETIKHLDSCELIDGGKASEYGFHSKDTYILEHKECKPLRDFIYECILHFTKETLMYSISVNDSLYSSAFVYAPKRSFGIVNLFVPLATHKMQINTTGKSLKQMDSGGLIKDYVFNYNEDNKENLKVDEVIIIQTTDGVNILNSVSRIESLKYPLSNIKAQYNKRNVLLENMGAIGILSTTNSDLGGALPMSPEEKEKIQRDWYNRSKDEIIISENEVKWTPMSFKTKDLMLFEELKADKLAIIDAFGLNYYIFSNEDGSTYSNVNYGERLAYTNTIIPESKHIYDNITEQLGLDKEGLRLTATFDHIPVLQNDILQDAQAINYRTDALIKMQETLGITLSDEEKRMFIGLRK